MHLIFETFNLYLFVGCKNWEEELDEKKKVEGWGSNIKKENKCLKLKGVKKKNESTVKLRIKISNKSNNFIINTWHHVNYNINYFIFTLDRKSVV